MVNKYNILSHLIVFLSNPIYTNKIFFAFFAFLLSALIVDSSFLKIYTFLNSFLNATSQYVIFVLFVSIFILCQYFLLSVVRLRIRQIESTWSFIKVLHKIIILFQSILSLLLLIAVLEIFFASFYSTIILIITVIISYGSSCISLGLLSIRFYSWFRARGFYAVLMYGLSSSIFVISNLFLMLFVIDILPQIGTIIQPHGHVILYFNNPGSYEYFIYNSYVIFSILSFIVTWIATSIILSYYAKRIGNVRYWFIISLPLMYFLSQFSSLFLNFFYTFFQENIFFYMVFFSILFSISKAIGGIQFGIAFWVMVRKTNKIIVLRNFLMVVAIGFMLLFVSEQAVSMIYFPYPPFGLTSVATLGLSSYLILIGLYYSAISISDDVKMRNYILSTAVKELAFLRKIGSAQIEEEMEKIVSNLVNQNLPKNKISSNEIDSPENMKSYVDDIMNDLRKIKGGLY